MKIAPKSAFLTAGSPKSRPGGDAKDTIKVKINVNNNINNQSSAS
jgi:hypothetical protein